MKCDLPARLFWLLLGSFILAFGLCNIHACADVTEGGVLGLTLLLQHWTGLSPAISSLVLNSACFVFGWRTLGHRFLWYSAVACCGYALFYMLFEPFAPMVPLLIRHPAVYAVSGALFVGVGCGLSIRAGGAPSGDDALAMALSERLHLPIERIYLATDLIVLLLSLSYIPLQRIAWSLLTVLLSGQIIGRVQRLHLPGLTDGLSA